MIGARKLLVRHTQGSRIVYDTPYEGVSGVIVTPDDYSYNDEALLNAVVYMGMGGVKTRRFHSRTNAQNYVENRLIDAIRAVRKGVGGGE